MATQEQISPEEELQALARAEKEFQALALAAADGDGDEGDLRALAGEAGAAMLAAASRYTAEHSDDVVMIADAICDQMEIGSPERADLLAAARLHDIGKTSIPIAVIEKPGPLTHEEWEQMKQHTIAGQRILSAIPELAAVGTIVRHSHERWDGRGYPDGLAGEEIPLASRVIFCADAFDAIRCTRPYRDGATAAESLAEIKRNSGTQFDPDVVTALIDVTRRLRLIPATRRTGNASRLASLLMIVALGATGSAAAKMGLLDSSSASASTSGPGSVPAPTKCVSLDCSGLLGVSLSDQFRAGDSRADGGAAAGAISVGLGAGSSAPSRGDDAASGGATETQGADPGSSDIAQPPVGGSPGAGTPNNDPAPAGNDQSGSSGSSGSGNPGNSGNGKGNGNGNSGQGNSGNSGNGNSGNGNGNSGTSGSGSGNSGNGNGNSGGHPQGGPPGQTGQHPQGGPPGQTGNPPVASNAAPQQPQSGPSGQSNGNGPGGSGAPGQAKKP